MITSIILLAITVLCLIHVIKTDMDNIFTFLGTLFFGLWFIIHILIILTQGYYFELFVEKRNSFEMTLQNSREKGNDLEAAAIVKEVAEWNMKLAEDKFDNKHWYLGQFVDDRIETLNPIE